jgi:hypothetical protein
MDGWWDETDNEILEVLRTAGPMDPVDLGRALGMSTAAVCSCLAMLSTDGKVRIRSVEAAPVAPGLERAPRGCGSSTTSRASGVHCRTSSSRAATRWSGRTCST